MPTSDNGGSSNIGLAAGLGAGLGAAAVIIAGLAFFLIRSRRKKDATVKNEKAELGQSDNQLHGATGTPLQAQSQVGGFGRGNGSENQQYFDPPKHAPQQPGELPAGAGHERVEMGDYSSRTGQWRGPRAELGG